MRNIAADITKLLNASTKREVITEYRKLCLEYHSDKGGYSEVIKFLNAVNDSLADADPKKRPFSSYYKDKTDKILNNARVLQAGYEDFMRSQAAEAEINAAVSAGKEDYTRIIHGELSIDHLPGLLGDIYRSNIDYLSLNDGSSALIAIISGDHPELLLDRLINAGAIKTLDVTNKLKALLSSLRHNDTASERLIGKFIVYLLSRTDAVDQLRRAGVLQKIDEKSAATAKTLPRYLNNSALLKIRFTEARSGGSRKELSNLIKLFLAQENSQDILVGVGIYEIIHERAKASLPSRLNIFVRDRTPALPSFLLEPELMASTYIYACTLPRMTGPGHDLKEYVKNHHLDSIRHDAKASVYFAKALARLGKTKTFKLFLGDLKDLNAATVSNYPKIDFSEISPTNPDIYKLCDQYKMKLDAILAESLSVLRSGYGHVAEAGVGVAAAPCTASNPSTAASATIDVIKDCHFRGANTSKIGWQETAASGVVTQYDLSLMGSLLALGQFDAASYFSLQGMVLTEQDANYFINTHNLLKVDGYITTDFKTYFLTYLKRQNPEKKQLIFIEIIRSGSSSLLRLLTPPSSKLLAKLIGLAIKHNQPTLLDMLMVMENLSPAIIHLITNNEFEILTHLNQPRFKEALRTAFNTLDDSQKNNLGIELISLNFIPLLSYLLPATNASRVNWLNQAITESKPQVIDQIGDETLARHLIEERKIVQLEWLLKYSSHEHKAQLQLILSDLDEVIKAQLREHFNAIDQPLLSALLPKPATPSSVGFIVEEDQTPKSAASIDAAPAIAIAKPNTALKVPASYARLITPKLNVNNPEVRKEALISLLQDYCSNWFFRFHWFRNHIGTVSEVLKEDAAKPEDEKLSAEGLIAMLTYKISQKMESSTTSKFNPKGSLARRIQFFGSLTKTDTMHILRSLTTNPNHASAIVPLAATKTPSK